MHSKLDDLEVSPGSASVKNLNHQHLKHAAAALPVLPVIFLVCVMKRCWIRLGRWWRTPNRIWIAWARKERLIDTSLILNPNIFSLASGKWAKRTIDKVALCTRLQAFYIWSQLIRIGASQITHDNMVKCYIIRESLKSRLFNRANCLF